MITKSLKEPSTPEASDASLPPRLLQLLPAGTKVAGRDSHPLKNSALARRTLEKKLLQVVPKSLLGTAVNYTFNQWPYLTTYLDHGEVTPDNNAAENAIRPFVIGRKNWLFAGNQKGAEASACLYSLIETAKANNLEPY